MDGSFHQRDKVTNLLTVIWGIALHWRNKLAGSQVSRRQRATLLLSKLDFRSPVELLSNSSCPYRFNIFRQDCCLHNFCNCIQFYRKQSAHIVRKLCRNSFISSIFSFAYCLLVGGSTTRRENLKNLSFLPTEIIPVLLNTGKCGVNPNRTYSYLNLYLFICK